MAGAFDDREKGFERKYQLDEEQRFRAQARRDKLFGQWAAGKLGYAGAVSEEYAKTVVDANFEKPGDDDMLEKVERDFKAAGLSVNRTETSRALQESFAAAVTQIAEAK